ncbi:MAG TPA: hypothetical protein VNO84_09085 [Burkholderiaceae bacterium]|nr:hypothetical protein [Burkholderiaceae bacterium]
MMRPAIVIAAALAAAVLSAPVAAAIWKPGSSYVWTGRGNVYEANGPALVDGQLSPIFEPAPGGVYVGGAQPLRLPNYGSVTVQAGKVIPWANIVQGLGGLSTVGLAIDVGTAVWDWYHDAGVRPTPCGQGDPSCHGETQWEVADLDTSTEQVSAVYALTTVHGPRETLAFKTPEQACAWWKRHEEQHWYVNGHPVEFKSMVADVHPGWWRCLYTYTFPNYPIYSDGVQGVTWHQPWCTRVGDGQAIVKPTGGSCPDAAWRKAPWPDVEPRLGAGPKDPNKGPDIWQDVMRRGGEVPDTGQPPTTKGPSQVPGPTTTTTGPGGTTTTTTTYNITYNSNTVTVTETKVTTHPNGTQETTTSQPDVEPEPSPPADPDMPELPQLYERKYPDGLKGVWEQKKAAFLQSPLFQLIPGLTPAFGDAGCPVWTLPLGPWGTHDVSLPCWVWAAMRLIFICTALFTARKLVFGG